MTIRPDARERAVDLSPLLDVCPDSRAGTALPSVRLPRGHVIRQIVARATERVERERAEDLTKRYLLRRWRP